METQEETKEESTNFDSDKENTPSAYKCPLSLEIMQDPVIALDGHTYEREWIEDWLESNKKSPITQEELSKKTLFPNRSLKHLINQHQEKKKKKTEKKSSSLSVSKVLSCKKSSSLAKKNYWSKLNNKMMLKKNSFVISILNYEHYNRKNPKKNQEFYGGHPYILVEGLVEAPENGIQLFVRLYDIFFEVELSSFSNWNPMGRVLSVNKSKNINTTYPFPYGDKTFYQSKSYSYTVSRNKAFKMIKAIEKEKKAVNYSINKGGDPVLFQMVGPKDKKRKNSLLTYLFSQKDKGINSSYWCIEKLEVAGIHINSKSKSEKIVEAAKQAKLEPKVT